MFYNISHTIEYGHVGKALILWKDIENSFHHLIDDLYF
jgi:hypothetical protein